MKETNAKSHLLCFLVVFAFLSLCFSQGLARKLVATEKEDSPSSFVLQENPGFKRAMIEVTDYDGPGANTNTNPYLQIPPAPPFALSGSTPPPPEAPSPK